MEPEKKPRGRPPMPTEQKLIGRNVRLNATQWNKIDCSGGIVWLRALIDRAKTPS